MWLERKDRAISASRDRSLRVWSDPRQLHEEVVLTGHQAAVAACAISLGEMSIYFCIYVCVGAGAEG